MDLALFQIYNGINGTLIRCQKRRSEILNLPERAEVPLDTNQAERDLRMLCVKRKVSGGFRSEVRGETFFRIRSFISAFQKQGGKVWQGLPDVFRGHTPTLAATR